MFYHSSNICEEEFLATGVLGIKKALGLSEKKKQPIIIYCNKIILNWQLSVRQIVFICDTFRDEKSFFSG